jgi:NADH dehydrogenase/NADH:ubiquinone oxidoreductase subunit G
MTVKFHINGEPVEAKGGESVLDVARRYGFEIPSLCHHEAVVPYGACRLCLVEIAKGHRRKLTTSCNYEVLEGIEVITDSPAIRKHRAMVLELILAEAPDAEPVRVLAKRYGVTLSRFKPAAAREGGALRDCILCGLCARVCTEVVKANALTFNGRGDQRGVGTPYGEACGQCVGCASCASVCPTNHIVVKDTRDKREIWGREFAMVRCESCGAPVMTEAHRDHAVKVGPLPADYFKTCTACKRKSLSGRFAKVGS